jgi:serine/threonine-protein kinase RsbW
MAKTTINTASVKIPSSTDHLSDVREFVSTQARNHGFNDDDVNKIALAVDEACTNIIKHGYNFSPLHFIEVQIARNGGLFEIVITDQGKQFDPNGFQSPDMKEYLTHYRRGGLGIYLMKRIMDKVEFKVNSDRNILRMTKTLH